MDARTWTRQFFLALDEAVYPDDPESRVQWTAYLGEALELTGQALGCEVAELKPDSRNRNESGEHLKIDAMFFDAKVWERLGPNEYGGDPLILPCVAVEVENDYRHSKIAYCLWKLLMLRCSLRVLLCCQPDKAKVHELVPVLERLIKQGKLALGLQGELVALIGDKSCPEEAPSWGDYYQAFRLQDGALVALAL